MIILLINDLFGVSVIKGVGVFYFFLDVFEVVELIGF